MKTRIFRFLQPIASLCLIAGCTWTGSISDHLDHRNPVSRPDPPANAYYLFAEAHLSLKKGDLDGAIQRMQETLALDPGSAYLKREMANLWLMKKDTDAAIDLLEDILVENPDDVDTLILTGRIYQNMDDAQRAMDVYSRVIDLDPSRQDIYLTLGGLYMDHEQWESAKAVYLRLVERFPGAYAGYFFLGRIAAMAGEFEQAREYFEKTLALEPELMESRFALGALYESEGQFKRAATIYNQILQQDPDNIRAGMALGHAMYQRGLKKQAQAQFTQLGRRSIEDENVVRLLVRHYLDDQAYPAAVVITRGMLLGAPDSSDLKYLAGVALDGIGKKTEAIAYFKQVEPGSRFFQNAAIHAALLYQEMEQLPTAIDFMEAVAQKDPDNPEFRLYLGSFYEQQADYAEAERALKGGLALDPDNSRLHFRLGVVYDKWGRKEDSIAAMQAVIRIDPDNANALNYLGYTYADMGIRLDEAESLIRRALARKPGDGYITDSLAWVYYQRGQYEKALPLLEEAARLVPDDPVVQEHLGDVYRKLGRIDDARESYRRAIENGHTDKASVEAKIRSLTP